MFALLVSARIGADGDGGHPAGCRRGWAVGVSGADEGADELVPWARAAMAELAGLLLETDSFTGLAQGVAELAVRTIEPVVTCGITLAERDRVMTVAHADELAVELDEHQYARGGGPCLTALQTGQTVLVADLAVEPRWDGYPALARERGVAAVLCIPLIVAGQTRGVLNLYGAAAHGFGQREVELAGLLAGQAVIAAAAALRHFDQLALTEHLHTALGSRSVIDQALGIIMARQRCTDREAFAILRAVSQRRGIKIRALAAELVAATAEPRAPRRRCR